MITNQQIQGLTTQEVASLRAAGKGAILPPPTSRSYAQILREDAFTLINNILFVLCLVLLALGQISEAFVSAGTVLFNVVISVIQEVRAKRSLDRIALLTRPKARVLRDGQEQFIDPGEIVQGDLLVLNSGDQVIVDGHLAGNSHIEVDESLLTGESDAITKREGDILYSGSFCVSGSACYRAENVGLESLAGQLTTKARAFRRRYTPLQRQIHVIVQSLLLVALYIEIVLILVALANETSIVETVRMSVIVMGVVPIGLFLSSSVSYAMGALRLAGKHILMQRLSAVESLSNVDVLCLDKTGTITTNKLVLERLHPVAVDEARLRALLALFVAHSSAKNATSKAIEEACRTKEQLTPLQVGQEIVFSSEYKWSGLSILDAELQGVYILGAPEILSPHLRGDALPGSFTKDETSQGLRVLLFAFLPEIVSLTRPDTKPVLPDNLILLGLVSLRDELRQGVQQTLEAFSALGIQIKVISGDNPETVTALARQVGITNTDRVISGRELERMDDAQLVQVATETTIFGRITPQQKERLVSSLCKSNHYVAMIGDGVNDVLSLKQANLGIAMESGSQAARGIADLILLEDSFTTLPDAFAEGQRIRNGMENVMKLFLTRVFYLALLLFTIPVLGAFPFAPKQKALVTFETLGLMAVALATWAHPGPPERRGLGYLLLHFVIPAAITVSLTAFGVYIVTFYQALQEAGDTLQEAQLIAQTALTSFAVCSGLLLIPFVVPPTKFWVGGSKFSGDWRPTLLAVALLIVYLIVISIPPLRAFFSLASLHLLDYMLIGAAALLWSFIQRWIWRAHLLERFLQSGSQE